MSVFQYLQLQPVDPQDDGTVSDLDQYEHDETIDLNEDSEGEDIIHAWEQIEHDMHEPASTK
jgi:hypothetical protein